jgi:acylphosphatase
MRLRRCLHYIVAGRVQGVFYRASACEAAQRLGLTGWVRNRADGRVEAVACGDAEGLSQFAAWLRRGPAEARVTEVQADACDDPGCADFSIRR